MKRFLFSLYILFGAVYLNAQTTLNSVWMKGFGSATNEEINGSYVDANGNIYLVGRITGSLDLDPGPLQYTVNPSAPQAYFAKYSSAGNLVWARVIGGTAESNANAITADANGNVIVAGMFENGVADFNLSAPNTNTYTANFQDMYLLKYTSAGVFSTVQIVASATCQVNPTQLKFDGSGNLIVAGDFAQNPATPVNFNPAGPTYTIDPVGFRDGFIAKYDPSWQIQFAIPFGSIANDYLSGMDVDASGNVYVTGSFQANNDFDPTANTYTINVLGSEAMYIAKYSNSGTMLWAEGFGGTSSDGGYQLVLDNSSNLLVYGYMTSPSLDADPTTNTVTLTKVGTGTYNAILGKYNPLNGNLIWAKNTGGSGNILPYALRADASNNIYLAGAFDDVIDFDFTTAGVINYTASTVSSSDIYLAKYNSVGDFIFNYNFGGASSTGNEGRIMQILSGNDILLGGLITGTIDLDPSIANNTVPYVGSRDVFFSTYSQCITADVPTITASSTTMCANGVVTLSIGSGSLNSATNWAWKSMSCSSSAVGTGTTFTVSPVFATSYFVRGEGGCPTPSNCASITISVTPSTDITGVVTTSPSVPVTGSVVIYRYEGPGTLWDYVGFQNINASGNYTFNAVNSGSYIIMCQPVASSLQTTYAPNKISWKGATVFGHGCNVNTNLNIDVQPLTNIGTGPGELSGKITEGVGYGNRGTIVPGNPIGGLNIKGGKNPGGNIVAQGRTNSSGEYTLSGLPI
ncbi:MAG: hypothetical protein ACK5ZT_07225, partial [Sphingobacteriaceae bacterium]